MRECLKLLMTRKSVRKFKPDKIEDSDLQLILEAAIRAPSGGNLQPWSIYFTKNNKIKNELAKAAYNQSYVAEAPVVIIVCGIPDKSAAVYGERGRTLYYIQDTAAMTQNILLAAHALGYGSVWVGAFDESKVARILNLDKGQRPMAIIPIGLPDEQRPLTEREQLSKIIHEL